MWRAVQEWSVLLAVVFTAAVAEEVADVEVDGEDGVSSGDLIRTVLSVLESHTLRGTHPLPEV